VFSIAAGLLFLLYCRAIVPFEPYQAYGYSVSPQKVCPGGAVKTTIDRSMSEGATELEYLSFWKRSPHTQGENIPEGPPQWPGESGTLDAAPIERTKVTSPILRTAPDDPGVWILHTNINVYGKVGPVNRSQEVELVANDTPLTVLRESDPRCK
jgi:hypothetical protein